MRAIGITCGIGSMLVGARQAGFEVTGNVEWRKYYHVKDEHGRNTFRENFPGAVFVKSREKMTDEEFRKFSNPDLALGHPECGNFSQLSGANADKDKRLLDPADIPLFINLVAELRPRYFVMDDLPKSFMAYSMAEYAACLPDYDLFPEWISNWGYGNVQKGRKRMFMLGSLKSERWAFRPGESPHGETVASVLEDLPTPTVGSNFPNHDPHDLLSDCPRAGNMKGFGTKANWGEVKKFFSDKPSGYTLDYPRKDGSMVKRIGFLKGHWKGPAHVLTGGNATLHFHRNEPYTIRERARIQGFPDDFVFYGTRMNERGEWDHSRNPHMVKQTGKAMPVQFCRYISAQIAARIQRKPWHCTDLRVMKPDPHIDEAKIWYCQNIGYSNQKAACRSCWLRKTCPMTTVPADAKGEGLARMFTP